MAPRLVGTEAPAHAIYPAAAYRMVDLFPGANIAVAYDVNDRGSATGMADASAFYSTLSGAVRRLQQGRMARAVGWGINAKDVVVGNVEDRAGVRHPAVWLSPSNAPVILSFEGTLYGINDHNEAVGEMIDPATRRPMPVLYDIPSGTLVPLPLFKGITGGTANDINNDRQVAGTVVSPTITALGALWAPTGAGTFSVTSLGALSHGEAIDDGRTIAGRSGNQAAWGKPSYAGTLGGFTDSWAYGINTWREVTGIGDNQAWVGDLNGAITVLPSPKGSQRDEGRAISTCGAVVGWSVIVGPTGVTNTIAMAWVPPGC